MSWRRITILAATILAALLASTWFVLQRTGATTGLVRGFLEQLLRTQFRIESASLDPFGGSITIRERKEGALRINLNCSRGLDAGDLNVTDVAGDIPASAVKKQGELRTAEAVLELNGGAEGAPPKKVRVKLQRRGGALWVEAVFLQPGDRKGWLDGIYRWYPVPEMAE